MTNPSNDLPGFTHDVAARAWHYEIDIVLDDPPLCVIGEDLRIHWDTAKIIRPRKCDLYQWAWGHFLANYSGWDDIERGHWSPARSVVIELSWNDGAVRRIWRELFNDGVSRIDVARNITMVPPSPRTWTITWKQFLSAAIDIQLDHYRREFVEVWLDVLLDREISSWHPDRSIEFAAALGDACANEVEAKSFVKLWSEQYIEVQYHHLAKLLDWRVFQFKPDLLLRFVVMASR